MKAYKVIAGVQGELSANKSIKFHNQRAEFIVQAWTYEEALRKANKRMYRLAGNAYAIQSVDRIEITFVHVS